MMRLGLRSRLIVLIAIQVIALTGIRPATARSAAQSDAPSDLDTYAARVLKDFEVPGLAVGIVKDGRLILAKGYGVRKIGEPTPVDEHTLFGIASNTKAFTAAALATLVDEGKIKWDDPVIKHMPSFQMYDPYVTREMTIRDLLTHRSGLGLGAGDLMFWPHTTFTRDEIVQRLRFIKPASSFRSRYAYDNILYLVAGQIIPAVTGKSWDDFIKERIFARVGMSESNTSTNDLRAGGNFVSPHAKVEGKVQAIPYNNLDNNAPAGAINSNVSDMAKWMRIQLARGAIDGSQRLFSERQSREMWSSQTILPVGDPPPALAALKANFSSYGLGWGLTDYRGHKVVSHTGGLAGMVSRVTLVPDLNLGIVVLTNQESGGAFQCLTYHVLDYYLGAPATDWIAGFRSSAEQGQKMAAEFEKRLAAVRKAESKPHLDLSGYAGRYEDAWYGDVTISLEGGKLVMKFSRTPVLVGDLEHWQYDTFIARWRDRSLAADAFVTFSLKPNGTIDQMRMDPVSPLTDFSYDFQDLLFRPAPASRN